MAHYTLCYGGLWSVQHWLQGGHGLPHTGSWRVMIRPALALEESWFVLYLVLGSRGPFHTRSWGGRGQSYTVFWGIMVHPTLGPGESRGPGEGRGPSCTGS